MFSLVSCRSYSVYRFRMSSQGGVASTNAASKGKKGVRLKEGVGLANGEKSVELILNGNSRSTSTFLIGLLFI